MIALWCPLGGGGVLFPIMVLVLLLDPLFSYLGRREGEECMLARLYRFGQVTNTGDEYINLRFMKALTAAVQIHSV